jgi:hypothetical protein
MIATTCRKNGLRKVRKQEVFYHYGIGQQYRACFGGIPHYDRFVNLMPRLFAPLMVLLHSLNGEETGICFAASSKLAVCHNRRIHRHKVFEGLAARGKTGMGWFFGLKLHFVINHKGQIMALKITPGNTDDSAVLDDMTRHPTGKAFAGKGYIGKDLFKKIWRRGRHLITGIRRNMKNYLMPMADKIMLRKRFIIETVLDTLKSEMGLEHSRHRSPVNAMVDKLTETEQTFTAALLVEAPKLANAIALAERLNSCCAGTAQTLWKKCSLILSAHCWKHSPPA